MRTAARRRPRVETLEVRSLMSTIAGALDPTFGGGLGYSSVPPLLPSGAAPYSFQGAQVSAVAVQPDGKILVAGNFTVETQSPDISFQRDVSELIRFNADGTLDTTFGQGGQVILPFDINPFGPGTNQILVESSGVVVQPDGKIVVAGEGSDSGNNQSYAAVRLNADGSVDTSFGNDGVADYPSTVPTAGRLTTVTSELLQPNGQIILAGSTSGGTTSNTEFAAVRLNADGSLDTTFGQGGTALAPVTVDLVTLGGSGSLTTDTLTAAALQSDGKILLAGEAVTGQGVIAPPAVTGSTTEGVVVRLNADGSVDTSYGIAGTRPLPADPTNPLILGSNTVTGIALQPNGDLLVSGTAYVANTSAVSGNYLTRILPSGLADDTFGSNGRTMPIVSGAVAVQSDGQIVVAGQSFVAPSYRSAVARLNPDGTPDTSFGDPGTPGLAQASLNFVSSPLTLAIQPSNGDILLAGTGTTPSLYGPIKGFAVGRLLPEATTGPAAKSPPIPVADFDGSGQSDIAIYDPNYATFAYRPAGYANENGADDQIVPFGIAGAGQTIPAPGNYQGFGQDNIAAYLSAYGVYAIRPLDGSPDELIPFGIAGVGQSIPAPGDYEGTGRDDIAVYMPSIATFGIRPSTGGPDELIPFGIAGAGQSIPAPADYFGTGQTDIAVYLAAYGAFAIRPPGGGPDQIIPFGLAGVGKSIPVPGDYDGSGHTELAVYIPSLGVFAYRPFNGGPDVIVPFGTANDGSYPVPGDYDGSGRTDFAVYDPNYGTFAYRPADYHQPLTLDFYPQDVTVPFGTARDGTIPVATPEGALPSFQPAPTTKVTTATTKAGTAPSTSKAGTAKVSQAAATPAGPTLAARRVALSPVAQASGDPSKPTSGS